MEGLIFGGRAYIPNVLSVSEYSGLIRGGGLYSEVCGSKQFIIISKA